MTSAPQPGMATLDIYAAIQHSYLANALYVLTRHGVFDLLLTEAKSADALARDAGMDAAALGALLDAAVSCGYLKAANGGYRTARAGLLLSQRSGSWLRTYLMVWGEQLQPAFMKLDSYATSGANAFQAALGAPIWDYYGSDPAQHKHFVEFMAQVTDQVHIPAIIEGLHVGQARTLVDVGGGTGSLMCKLLAAYPDVQGTVYDQPRNRGEATARIHAQGLDDRCAFVGGNMFASVPGGADLYLIKHVLHDWDDDNAATILAAIAKAMGPDATLVLIEGLMDTTSVGENAHLMHARNLEQRVWTEGRVRASCDFERLCEGAGLEIVEIQHAPLLDVSYLYCKQRI